MPKDEADEDDPMELVGVQIGCTEEELEEVARCFIEEFAWISFDRERLLALFRQPVYPAVHRIHQQMGEAWVARVIDKVVREMNVTRTDEATNA